MKEDTGFIGDKSSREYVLPNKPIVVTFGDWKRIVSLHQGHMGYIEAWAHWVSRNDPAIIMNTEVPDLNGYLQVVPIKNTRCVLVFNSVYRNILLRNSLYQLTIVDDKSTPSGFSVVGHDAGSRKLDLGYTIFVMNIDNPNLDDY